MVSLEVVSIIVFLAVIAALVYRDRKKIEFKSILIMRRTQKGKEWIYRFGQRHERLLKIIGNFGIIFAVVASVLGSYLLVTSAYNLILKPDAQTQSLRFVLPTVSGVELPGFILGVPFWFWIIGVFLVMFSHEGMHALLARAERIKIKSFGVLLLLVLPGAFVEPDEKQLKRSSTIKKLRIYAAGSFGNFLLAGIILILILGYNFALAELIAPQGVTFESLIPGTGAESIGLKGTILQINSQEVRDVNDFANSLANVAPGDTIQVKTTEGTFQVKTVPHPDDPSRPFIGIQSVGVEYTYSGVLSSYGNVSTRAINVITWFASLLGWSLILNLGVGIFNLFPLKPLDGGLIFEEVLKFFYSGKWANSIVNTVSVIVLLLVVFNLFGNQIAGLFI